MQRYKNQIKATIFLKYNNDFLALPFLKNVVMNAKPESKHYFTLIS